jgi:hypothetical protein
MTAIKKMQAGRETKMRRGAMWACAIPIIFGLGFIYLVVDIAWGYQSSLPLILSISPAAYPALCLLILSPVTAWLSCGWLRRIDDPAKLSQWRISFVTALVIATGLQLFMTLGYGLFLDYQFKAIFGSASESLTEFGMDSDTLVDVPNGHSTSAIYNAVLWIVLTAPFCAAGASIFQRVTKFPEDRTVF